MPSEPLLRKNLSRACSELGVRVTIPATVAIDETIALSVDAVLPDFGAPNGLIVVRTLEALLGHEDRLTALGYAYSVLDDEADAYHIENYKMLFSDWGWSSPLPGPDWLLSSEEIDRRLSES